MGFGKLSVRKLGRARFVLLAALPLLGLGVMSGPGQAVPLSDPGPYFPLELGYSGESYDDRLPGGASYSIATGRLPRGLTLSSSGRVQGTPSETGAFSLTLTARENSGARYPVRVSITVFESDESDFPQVRPAFTGAGPYGTTVDNIRLTITNTFDGAQVRTRVRIVRPVGLAGPAPLLLYHRGRGFDEDSYKRFHEHIASWGIAVASVEDQYSFAGATFSAGNTQYDFYRAELGMQSASGVVEAVSDYLIDRSDDPFDSFAGSFDSANLFMAGHSRGGGATHASHHRDWNLRLKGVIYLMAFDLRYFDDVRPPARAPAYPIFAQQPRTPSLIIAAENDGDLTYPICDQLIDRATGPTTQVTVYGAVHNLISDSHPAEGVARISRSSERTQVADWIVCFIKRWAELDTDLDWRLYGGAQQGSQDAGVTAWRASSRTVVFEDAQDADAARNLVGRNLVASMRRRELSIYPPVGDLPSLGLQHTLLEPQANVAVWRLLTDSVVDLSDHQRLVMRMSQTGNRGWSGMAVWLRFLDQDGGASWYRLWDPAAGGHLPEYDGLSPHDRFVDVHVELDRFFPGSSTSRPVNRARARALDIYLVTRDASRAGDVVTDMIRFE